MNTVQQLAVSVTSSLAAGATLLLIAVSISYCTRVPAPPPIVIVDADASNLADVGAFPTECMLACKVLLDTNCHPVSTCVHTCDDLIGVGIFPVAEVACVAHQTTREGVIACGGGFCR